MKYAEIRGSLSLGDALSAKCRLIAWCKACGHQFEPDVAELAAHHAAGTTVAEWADD